MASMDIGPRIGIEGEAQFRKELQNINQGLRTLGSEMNVVTSAFIGQEKSEESLAAQNDVLGRTVASLEEKLAAQQKMLQESVNAYGEADSRTQKWQQAVNATQAELNKANAQIAQSEQSIKDLTKATEEQGEAADDAGERNARLGEVLGSVTKAVAAMAAATAVAVTAVGKLTLDAAYAADDLNTMAKTTGLSTEELQRFQFASEQIDVSLDTLTGSMSKLTKNMATAAKGSGDAYDAFKSLGIEVENQDGSLRERNEVFRETIDALGKIENETKRDATAMAIFGKSAQELNPLILGGAEALQELGNQAENAGLILSQDALDQLNLVSDAMDNFKATSSSAGNIFTVGFAEPLAKSINTVTEYIQRLTKAFSEGIDALANEFQAVADDLSAKINEYLPELVEFGTKIITNLILGIVNMAPEIVATAATIILTLVSGLTDMLPELIPAAVDVVLTIVDALLDNLDLLIDAALKIILALTEGLLLALPKLVEKAPEIILDLIEALVGAFPMLVSAGGDIIQAVADGVMGSIEAAKAWGQDLIDNFVAGIQQKWGELKAAVSSVAQTVKDILGFSEPKEGPLSNFHTYAPDMMKLYAKGITGNAWRVESALDSALQGVADGMAAAIPTPAPAVAGVSNSDTYGGYSGFGGVQDIVINLTSTLDGAVLARNQFRYNMAEMNRHGPSLVTGGAMA